MKLKEAQMLGILALIAVGIILLCMWGGQEPDADVTVRQAGGRLADSMPSDSRLADLYRDLLVHQPMPPAEEPGDEYLIDVGVPIGSKVEPVNEEVRIQRVIEERSPAEIPLMPAWQEAEDTQQSSEPEPLMPRAVTHIVQKGETLSSISKQYYGTVGRWRDIQKANGIADPRRMAPGVALRIPPAEGGSRSLAAAKPALSSNASQDSSARLHTVKKGDTLWRIAQRYYDDGSKWKTILAANRHLLDDAEDVRPGMQLRVP